MLLTIICSCFFYGCVSRITVKDKDYVRCVTDKAKQESRSRELKRIYDEDQGDREGSGFKSGAVFRDRKRRMRVAEIFGEGCFKTAEDYSNAAMVFQHGERPEHFWQAFQWAKKADSMGGDKSKKRMMALTVDRYLTSSGKKQLFGSQALLANGEKCFCLYAVEPSFPASKRLEFMGATLEDQFKWVDSLNSGNKCPQKNFCSAALSPTPSGSIIGFW